MISVQAHLEKHRDSCKLTLLIPQTEASQTGPHRGHFHNNFKAVQYVSTNPNGINCDGVLRKSDYLFGKPGFKTLGKYFTQANGRLSSSAVTSNASFIISMSTLNLWGQPGGCTAGSCMAM
jgi:hypothetical protein